MDEVFLRDEDLDGYIGVELLEDSVGCGSEEYLEFLEKELGPSYRGPKDDPHSISRSIQSEIEYMIDSEIFTVIFPDEKFSYLLVESRSSNFALMEDTKQFEKAFPGHIDLNTTFRL